MLIAVCRVGRCGTCAGTDGQFVAGSFDSLSAVELSNGIATALGLQLPGTLVFDYPSVRAMAAHVQGLMAPASAIVATHVTAASLIASPTDAHASELLAKARLHLHSPRRSSHLHHTSTACERHR